VTVVEAVPDGEGGVVIVPRTPGPLLDPDDATRRRVPDEIDKAIDEIFGPDPAIRPGGLDVALLGIGIAVILWAQFDHQSGGFTAIGAICVLLGLVLPVRSFSRALRERRATRRRRAVWGRGLALDVSDPLTRLLAEAYTSILEAPEGPSKLDAASAGLMAVTEVATLLAGQVPRTAADREYVQRRTAAIEKLTQSLCRQDEDARGTRTDGEDTQLERQARAAAGEELDALGLSSLTVLDALARQAEAASDS
jgi:hypothetical protein